MKRENFSLEKKIGFTTRLIIFVEYLLSIYCFCCCCCCCRQNNRKKLFIQMTVIVIWLFFFHHHHHRHHFFLEFEMSWILVLIGIWIVCVFFFDDGKKIHFSQFDLLLQWTFDIFFCSKLKLLWIELIWFWFFFLLAKRISVATQWTEIHY